MELDSVSGHMKARSRRMGDILLYVARYLYNMIDALSSDCAVHNQFLPYRLCVERYRSARYG